MKMRIHKRYLIHLLACPDGEETLKKVMPKFKGTPEEAIEALKEDPREFVDEFEGEEE